MGITFVGLFEDGYGWSRGVPRYSGCKEMFNLEIKEDFTEEGGRLCNWQREWNGLIPVGSMNLYTDKVC